VSHSRQPAGPDRRVTSASASVVAAVLAALVSGIGALVAGVLGGDVINISVGPTATPTATLTPTPTATPGPTSGPNDGGSFIAFLQSGIAVVIGITAAAIGTIVIFSFLVVLIRRYLTTRAQRQVTESDIQDPVLLELVRAVTLATHADQSRPPGRTSGRHS
jgi:hypothetical protein